MLQVLIFITVEKNYFEFLLENPFFVGKEKEKMANRRTDVIENRKTEKITEGVRELDFVLEGKKD